MKSPVFQIINDFLKKKRELKSKCFLKTNAEGKHYFKILLPNARESLKILEKTWAPNGHHVSIYEDQTWSDLHYQSTYHYTGSFVFNNEEIIVHAYFNRYGEYVYNHVKTKGNIALKITDIDEASIQLYAEDASIKIISLIQQESNDLSSQFIDKLNNAMQKLCITSQELSQEKEETIEDYLKQIEICLKEVERVERYTYTPHKSLQSHLTLTKNHFENKLKEIKKASHKKPTKNSKTASEQKIQKEEVIQSLTLASKQPKKSLELENIQTKLETLQTIVDPIDRIINHFRLLEKKYKLLNPSEINTILSVFKELNDIRALIRQELITRAENGEVNTVNKLAPFVDDIPFNLYFSCVKRGGGIIKLLLNHYKININQIKVSSDRITLADKATIADTLLIAAIREDQYNTLQFLLQKKANPNIPNPFYGETPLMIAAEHNQTNYVKLLLEHKADPNVRSIREATLFITTDKRLAEIIEKFSRQKDREHTVLHIAVENQNSKIVKLLLDYGADWSMKDINGFSCFMASMTQTSKKLAPEIVSLFLDKGANIDEQHPIHRYTGLYFACQSGYLDDVKFLLGKGADPNIRCMPLRGCLPNNVELTFEEFSDKQFTAMTPLMKAAAKGFDDIVNYLITQKIKSITLDNVWDTYRLALLAKKTTIIQFLEDTYDFLPKNRLEIIVEFGDCENSSELRIEF